MLKTKSVHSKKLTASNHLPSPTKIIGVENETHICLFILKSSVSCGFAHNSSFKVSVCFSLELTIIFLN